VTGEAYSGGAPRTAVNTLAAPPPVGAYSQAVEAGGFVFISGQTPRSPDGQRLLHLAVEDQITTVLDNLEAIARAAGASMSEAVQVTVFLVDPADAPAFDRLYRDRVGDPAPARAIVQSNLTTGALEVTAILYRGRSLPREILG
jgi:2-iminobutanoate/2-iminopropanoate deaminase